MYCFSLCLQQRKNIINKIRGHVNYPFLIDTCITAES